MACEACAEGREEAFDMDHEEFFSAHEHFESLAVDGVGDGIGSLLG